MKPEEKLEALRAEKVTLETENIALRVVQTTLEEQVAMNQTVLATLTAYRTELEEQVAQQQHSHTDSEPPSNENIAREARNLRQRRPCRVAKSGPR